ncbi:MAG TPA: amidohydrolase family protein [Desulfatiglandales bacterium]|nr:amidohydrolase family protein [Desulfatiglandales bacterium]
MKKKMSAKVRIIDSWVNPFPDNETAEAWKNSKPFRLMASKYKSNILEMRIEHLLEYMEKYNVDKAVLTGVDSIYWYISNDWVAEQVKEHPDKLIGCAAVDPEKGMKAIYELERAVKGLGLKGVLILPYAIRKPINDKIMYPFFAKCCELNVPVHIQVGHTAPLLPSDVGRPIYLDEVALYFPELKILASHIGYPWTDEMIAMAWKHDNVYIDVGTHYPKYYQPQFLNYLNTYGQDKVLFASCFPLTDYDRQIKELNELDLRPGPKRKFLRDNAMKLWGL